MKKVTITVVIVITILGIVALSQVSKMRTDYRLYTFALNAANPNNSGAVSYYQQLASDVNSILNILIITGTFVSDILIFKALWPHKKMTELPNN